MARIAIMALEGLEDDEVAVGTNIPVEEIADQPENELSEMQAIATEMESGEDSIDEAAETAETLGEVQDQMAATLPDGGIEPAAAAAVEVAVEHMCRRLGFSAKQSGFALEAFGDKTTRVQATKIAMETIGEQIKKIWDAIVAAFKKAIAWVVSFYDKMFDGASKLAKRAAAVAAAAEAKIKSNSTLAKDSKVTKGLTNQLNFDKYLVKNNKFMSGAEILAACKQLTTIGAVEENAVKMLKSVGPITQIKENSARLKESIDSYILSMGVKPNSGGKEKAPEGMSLHEKDLPLGDFSIYAYLIKGEGGDVVKDIGKVKMFVASNSDKDNTGKVAETSFELKEIVSVSKEIEQHMGKYSAIRSKQQELKAAQETIQKDAEKEATKSTTSEEDKKKIMENASWVRVSISLTSTGLSAIRSYDINACKAVLDYASKSLGNYGAAA